MRSTIVDILSDQTNAAVMRHPERRFPGILIQGDSIYALCLQADAACVSARSLVQSDDYDQLNDLRDKLWDYLNHYEAVLVEHQVPLPFSESAGD